MKKNPTKTEQEKIAEDQDAKVTQDDLDTLGTEELNMDGGDDDLLKDRTHPVNFSGDELDVPGSEDDDDMENIGEEDEENNSYSIGGDKHNDLEEDANRL
jgi:hypothetical protein